MDRSSLVTLLALLAGCAPPAGKPASSPPTAALPRSGTLAVRDARPTIERVAATITIDTDRALRTFDKRLFLGTNIAVWNPASVFEDPRIERAFRDAGVGIVRIPGGSMSDQYFWNGHGVRDGGRLDRSKYVNGFWHVDYSAFSPGFIGYFGFPKDPAKAELGTWHGNSDVKNLHEFIKNLGALGLVTTNAGNGTAKDAAEWVRWANLTMKYGVKWWEVGNELGGDWESGTARPDGKKMDAAVYGRIYAEFAKAMKAVDPTIWTGSQGGVDFIKGALATDAPLDFVSYHDYFQPESLDYQGFFKTLGKIRGAAKEAKDAVLALRPGKKILVGMTEYNCKPFTDEHTADVFSGLWVAAALGEMIEGGLDFALQWDAFGFDEKAGGGYGILIEKTASRKAEYWAFWTLYRYLGDTLVESRTNVPALRAYASKDGAGNAYVIAVNTSETTRYDTRLEVRGAHVGAVHACARFSDREYAWDPKAMRMPYDSGPSPFTARAGETLGIGPMSMVACKLAPPASVKTLEVVGPAELRLAPSRSGAIDVEAIDDKGQPARGVVVRARADRAGVAPASATTGNDGVARFTVSAAPGAAEGGVALEADGFAAIRHPVRTVLPTLGVLGPSRAPAGEPVTLTVAARYPLGDEQALLDTFTGPGVVSVTGAAPLSIDFDRGIAAFAVKDTKAGGHDIDVRAGGLSARGDITLFEKTAGEIVALRFESASDMKNVSSKQTMVRTDKVKPEDGVLSVTIHDAKGWTPDIAVFDKMSEVPNLDRTSITHITFDLMLDEKLQLGKGWAQLPVVLQSEQNWWMPLESVDLMKLPRGKWTKVKLAIKPEQRKAMAAFFKILFFVNGAEPIDGTIYIDNVGFAVEAR
jgi:hypothetical protein